MKVNVDIEITDLKNNPIKDGDDTVTLGTVIGAAMLNVIPQEDMNLPGNDKVEMFRIAQKSVDGGEQDFTAEQITLIKKRVAKFYSALVVGRVYDALEGAKVVKLV